MEEYYACGKKNKKFVPACQNCFEIWGDLFPHNARISCELDDIDTDLENDEIQGDYIIHAMRLKVPS